MTSTEAIRAFLRGSLDRQAFERVLMASAHSRREEEEMLLLLDLDHALQEAFSSLPETKDAASRLVEKLAAVSPGTQSKVPEPLDSERVGRLVLDAAAKFQPPSGAPERLGYLIRNWEERDVRAASKDTEDNSQEDEPERI